MLLLQRIHLRSDASAQPANLRQEILLLTSAFKLVLFYLSDQSVFIHGHLEQTQYQRFSFVHFLAPSEQFDALVATNLQI